VSVLFCVSVTTFIKCAISDSGSLPVGPFCAAPSGPARISFKLCIGADSSCALKVVHLFSGKMPAAVFEYVGMGGQHPHPTIDMF